MTTNPAGMHEDRLWPEILFILVSTLVLTFANLFGHLTVIERYGQQLFEQLFAPRLYPTVSRGQSLVVLLTDRDLAELKWTWPTDYANHAGILTEIRKRGPRAVVIDLLFVDERDDGTIEDLVTEIRHYGQDKIPLYLASAPDGSEPGVRSRLAESGVTLVPVPGLVGASGYRFFVARCDDQAGHHAPCQAVRPTAATAAYGAVCPPAGAPEFCQAPVLDVTALAGSPEAGHARLELFWGVSPDCNEVPGSVIKRLGQLAFRGTGAYQFRCPFTRTVPAARLLLDPPPDLDQWIAHRVVFYGADLLGGADKVQPPAREAVAGVYAHAMAFDNLLTWGRRYQREEVSVRLRLTSSPARILVAGFALLPLLWAARWVRTLLARRWALGVPGQRGLDVLAAAVLAGVAALLVFPLELGPAEAHAGVPALALGTLTPTGCHVALVLLVQGLLAWLFLRLEGWWFHRSRAGYRGLRAWHYAILGLYGASAVFVILLFAVYVEFHWLNLTPGNWLHAVLEVVIGKELGNLFASVFKRAVARRVVEAR